MKKSILYIMILWGLLCGVSGCGKTSELITEETKLSGSSGSEENSDSESSSDSKGTKEKKSDEKPKASLIYVQLSGAVVNPGVYSLPQGSRIFEAVKLAGGLTPDADMQSLNQAQTLEDGEMIYVLNQEEAKAQAPMPAGQEVQDGKVNLNTATEEQLMTLTGIGQAKAKSIITWREENGGFSQIEDLLKIQGIKDGVFSKIKDSIKVN